LALGASKKKKENAEGRLACLKGGKDSYEKKEKRIKAEVDSGDHLSWGREEKRQKEKEKSSIPTSTVRTRNDLHFPRGIRSSTRKKGGNNTKAKFPPGTSLLLNSEGNGPECKNPESASNPSPQEQRGKTTARAGLTCTGNRKSPESGSAAWQRRLIARTGVPVMKEVKERGQPSSRS